MDTSRDHSVGEILDQLLSDELIDACHITGDHVTIIQGPKRHVFPYQQARTFLMGMLRGRSWNLNPSGHEQPFSHLRAVDKNRESEPEKQRLSYGLPGIEPALDELLEIAKNMELIEGFEKSAGERNITVILSACQTQMSYEEAITFLAECVLYKLNALREEAESLEVQKRSALPSDRQIEKASLEDFQPVWQRLG